LADANEICSAFPELRRLFRALNGAASPVITTGYREVDAGS
jgi:hypothetical protein